MTAAVALMLAVALVILVYSYLLRPKSTVHGMPSPEPAMTGPMAQPAPS